MSSRCPVVGSTIDMSMEPTRWAKSNAPVPWMVADPLDALPVECTATVMAILDEPAIVVFVRASDRAAEDADAEVEDGPLPADEPHAVPSIATANAVARSVRVRRTSAFSPLG